MTEAVAISCVLALFTILLQKYVFPHVLTAKVLCYAIQLSNLFFFVIAPTICFCAKRPFREHIRNRIRIAPSKQDVCSVMQDRVYAINS